MHHRQHRRMTDEYQRELAQINKHPTLKMSQTKEAATSIDVAKAFKNKKPLRSGSHFTNGQVYKLFGKTIAEHTEKGLRVTNAGYDTPTTYRTLNQLGINSQIKGGVIHINNKPYKHGTFVTVPYNEVSEDPITQGLGKRGEGESGEIISRLRDVRKRSMEKYNNLSQTSIQPSEQRKINAITGVKSPIGKSVRATAAHHILYRRNVPGMQFNINNLIPLDRKSHSEAHRFDKLKLSEKLAALRSSTNTTVNRLNLLKRRSKKTKMAQIHPKANGIINQIIEDHGIDKEPFPRGSAFLSPRGDFLRGTGTHYSTVNQYGKVLGIGKSGKTAEDPEYRYVDDSDIHNFLQKTGLVRMQYISDRSGYRQSIHVADKLTSSQINRIKSLEENYPEHANIKLAFAVGPDFNHMDFGEGFSNFMAAYRKHFGQKGAKVIDIFREEPENTGISAVTFEDKLDELKERNKANRKIKHFGDVKYINKMADKITAKARKNAQAEGTTNTFNMTYDKSKPTKVKKKRLTLDDKILKYSLSTKYKYRRDI